MVVKLKPGKFPKLHASNRFSFQIFHAMDCYVRTDAEERYGRQPQLLNVGCADDPAKFGANAHHLDIDDWSVVHKYFTQAKAEDMPFEDESFDTVICGDVLEHVLDPMEVIDELCRVSVRKVVLTIFEEWRHGKIGRDIELGQRLSDEASRNNGYKSAEHAQKWLSPDRIAVSEAEIPHLTHIWQFDDIYIKRLFLKVITELPFAMTYFEKKFEVKHEDHDIYNWLIVLERIPNE